MPHIQAISISEPLRAIGLLFDEARAAARDDAGALSKSDWGVRDAFEKCLLENLSQVPQINSVPLDSIPANSLVRFHGMVQDMFDVEYYIGMHKARGVWHTHKYTDDVVSEDLESVELNHVLWERRLVYCVPVPGENQWVKAERASDVPSGGDSMTRRTAKRQHESEAEDMDCSVPMEEHKRPKTLEMDPDRERVAPKWNTDLNLLDKESNLLPCLVKIYDETDASLKLNDVAEIIGILTHDPALIVPSQSSDIVSVSGSFMEDDISVQLPATKVPRLHCILVKKLHSPYQLSRHPSDPIHDFASIRESLLVYLKSVLGDDRLAAEYLLLHLLSKVHSRVEPVAVGKLSLNFSGCQAGSPGALSPVASVVAKTISLLLPRSHLLGLSLDSLNTSSLVPRKDYSTNRLVTGALQLACGTHLTVDETALNTGQLNETGLKNLQSLKNLMESQKVDYDFQYYNMDMPADVPVLVISSGKSRLLPADALVPLQCATSAAVLDASESDLFKWRMYLSRAREVPHFIEPSMQKAVEDDLVAARQKDRSIGPDTFHKWLTMARLVSLSFGESSLRPERWELVKNLEMSCTARSSI